MPKKGVQFRTGYGSSSGHQVQETGNRQSGDIAIVEKHVPSQNNATSKTHLDSCIIGRRNARLIFHLDRDFTIIPNHDKIHFLVASGAPVEERRETRESFEKLGLRGSQQFSPGECNTVESSTATAHDPVAPYAFCRAIFRRRAANPQRKSRSGQTGRLRPIPYPRCA